MWQWSATIHFLFSSIHKETQRYIFLHNITTQRLIHKIGNIPTTNKKRDHPSMPWLQTVKDHGNKCIFCMLPNREESTILLWKFDEDDLQNENKGTGVVREPLTRRGGAVNPIMCRQRWFKFGLSQNFVACWWSMWNHWVHPMQISLCVPHQDFHGHHNVIHDLIRKDNKMQNINTC